jgi:ATP-dependent RNA helicase SUPV3L1/SUV3
MLSITGMTLEQFNDLMGGLGYKGEKGERAKVKAVATPAPAPVEPEAVVNPIPEEVSNLAPVAEEPAAEAVVSEEAAPEMEVFYTFTWAPKPRFQRPERGPRPERAPRKEGDAPRGERHGERQGERGPRKDGDRPARPEGERRGPKPEGGKPHQERGERKGGGKHDRNRERDNKPKSFESRPPRPEKPIDPDNPFAALLALKGKV